MWSVLFICSVKLVFFALFFSLLLRGKKRNYNPVFFFFFTWIFTNSKLGQGNSDYLFCILSSSSIPSSKKIYKNKEKWNSS